VRTITERLSVEIRDSLHISETQGKTLFECPRTNLHSAMTKERGKVRDSPRVGSRGPAAAGGASERLYTYLGLLSLERFPFRWGGREERGEEGLFSGGFSRRGAAECRGGGDVCDPGLPEGQGDSRGRSRAEAQENA